MRYHPGDRFGCPGHKRAVAVLSMEHGMLDISDREMAGLAQPIRQNLKRNNV
jgi:hypothetical protein